MPSPQLDGAELALRRRPERAVSFRPELARPDLLIRQARDRYSVEDVTIEEPELESIIRRIYVEGYDEPGSESDMILSSGTKKPKIHSSAYVAPTATISGDVTVGASCAILHGAIVVAEGAPVTIGADTVVMENAVSKPAAGASWSFRSPSARTA